MEQPNTIIDIFIAIASAFAIIGGAYFGTSIYKSKRGYDDSEY